MKIMNEQREGEREQPKVERLCLCLVKVIYVCFFFHYCIVDVFFLSVAQHKSKHKYKSLGNGFSHQSQFTWNGE